MKPPPPRSFPSRRRPSGAALFLVLWALLVVSVSLIVAVRLVDLDLENESVAARRFEARQLALSGLAVASHPDVEPRSPLLDKDFGDSRSWNVQIASENSRININRILRQNDTAQLRQLLAFWDLNERQIATIVDSLKDWVDEDNIRSLNGAEASDIPPDSGWSKPENRDFLDIAEMERVRGIEWLEEVKPDWREYFSVHAGSQADLQFARPDFLEAWAGIDRDRAAHFIRVRDGEDARPGTQDDVVFETLSDALSAIGANPAETEILSRFFSVKSGGLKRIESRGEVNGTSYTIECVVTSAKGAKPTILSWREF